MSAVETIHHFQNKIKEPFIFEDSFYLYHLEETSKKYYKLQQEFLALKLEKDLLEMERIDQEIMREFI